MCAVGLGEHLNVIVLVQIILTKFILIKQNKHESYCHNQQGILFNFIVKVYFYLLYLKYDDILHITTLEFNQEIKELTLCLCMRGFRIGCFRLFQVNRGVELSCIWIRV